MLCHGCQIEISKGESLKCNNCASAYCYSCLNLRKDSSKNLSADKLASLSCPYCQNVTRRKVNDNTQIGQINESMNSSFSQYISTDAQESAINTSTGSNLCNQPVTMESISMLFDIKLSPDSAFMTNLRSTLQKDMEKMVSVEVNRAIEKVKDDLTVSLDHFSAENQSIRTDISEKDARIKELESELIKSQSAVAKLQSRVTAVEKFSRDLNIEIYEVPENKNENLVALFKQMCECLQVSVTESDIGLCRRVAKMNPDSKRPRNVLVTLSSQRLRDVILSAVTRFNKSNPKDMLCATHLGINAASRIYVAEHLPAEVKDLHSAARKFCKDNNFKFCWVRFGRVSIRKDEKSPAILIKSIDFLNSLRRE